MFVLCVWFVFVVGVGVVVVVVVSMTRDRTRYSLGDIRHKVRGRKWRRGEKQLYMQAYSQVMHI